MKALLKKDIFVLFRQMRIFLLMIAIFAVIPQMNMSIFAIVYSGMLPYTSMAYDERSKWDNLAAMMPYTVGDIVLSKYALGWLLVAFSTVLSTLSAFIFGHLMPGGYTPAALLPSLCVGLLIIAVTLPPMFRFGVEKGRMFFIFLIVVLACGGAGLLQGFAGSNDGLPAGLTAFIQLGIPLLAAALTAVSIPLSIAMYKRRVYA